jgi:hypothetical protein
MEKILESYKILSYLASQIFFFIEIHNTYMENEETLNQIQFKGHYANLPFAKAISGNHLNYLLIIANSYIDEYNENFVPSKHPLFADHLSRLRKINKPILKRISRWTNFKKYRNYILAHNFRIKEQSIFDKDFKKFHFKVPHTNSEIILLAELIRMININIAIEFPDLLDDRHYIETIMDRISFEYTEVNVKNEIEKLIQEVELIRTDLLQG